VTRTARIVFGVLIVATVAAFFVAQRLKNQPAVLQMSREYGGFTRVFSPNGDGRRDTFTVRFMLKRATPVTVEIVDEDGIRVATLTENQPAERYKRITLRWDGRDDEGNPQPHGRYRLKFVLPEEGRSVVWASSFELNRIRPKPKVRRIAADGTRQRNAPAVLPTVDGKPIVAELQLDGWRPKARVVRTSPGADEVVARLPVEVTERARGGTRIGGRVKSIRGEARWDGTTDDGRPAPPGTYVIQVCVQEAAQIEGCGPTAGPDGMPRAEPSGRMRGRGGVTVRRVGVQTSPVPVEAGERLTFFVDARGERYRWTLRRVGTDRPVSSGSATRPVLRIDPRSRRGAAYRLTVVAGGERVDVPAFVNGAPERPVLVVLPAITWQGLNPLDDDGDGLANRLQSTDGDSATRIRTSRVFGTLPPAYASDVEPAIEWLVRHRKRFEITTDLALALQSGPDDREHGPQLEGHSGVLLVGEARWTTPDAAERMRTFVGDGGKVAVLDPASLHRSVELGGSVSRGQRLEGPGPFDPSDAFGIVSRGAVRLDGPLVGDRDEIDLFAGTDGRFDGYPTGWPAESLGDGKPVASAVDGSDHRVIVAMRLGKGLVIRTGLPTFAARLSDDPDTSELMESTWRRLSR
jgi:flagellar hook assembly protein FlgD